MASHIRIHPKSDDLYVLSSYNAVYKYNSNGKFIETIGNASWLMRLDHIYSQHSQLSYHWNGMISRENDITSFRNDLGLIENFRLCNNHYTNTKNYIIYTIGNRTYITNIQTHHTRFFRISKFLIEANIKNADIFTAVEDDSQEDTFDLCIINENSIDVVKIDWGYINIFASDCGKFLVRSIYTIEVGCYKYKIYRIQQNRAILLNQFNSRSTSFAISHDNSKCYLYENNNLIVKNFAELIKVNPAIFIILCAQSFDPESFFYEFPLDLIKVIVSFADLELAIPAKKKN